MRQNPINGEAAAGMVETRRFPTCGVSAYTPMCPEGTEVVCVQQSPSPAFGLLCADIVEKLEV